MKTPILLKLVTFPLIVISVFVILLSLLVQLISFVFVNFFYWYTDDKYVTLQEYFAFWADPINDKE